MDPAHPASEQAPTDAHSGQARCSTPQVLLGLFISAHLVFLLAANVLNFISDAERITGHETPGLMVEHFSGGINEKKGHWHDAYSLFNRWEQIGNCNQSWRMFSPNVGDWFSFVRVEMRWDANLPGEPAAPGARDPVALKAMGEPDDLYNYQRSGPWRFTRYEEFFMSIDFRVKDDETEPEAKARWKTKIRRTLDSQWDSVNAYLNWRWRRYKEEHADTPTPDQLIMLVHGYWISPPDEDYGKLNGPTVVPIARWQIGNTKIKTGTSAAIQAWDPETRRWTNRE
jgi:hypothetical protein